MSRRLGFTLIEVLIYLAILTTILLTVVLMVSEMFKIQVTTRNMSIMQNNIALANARIHEKVNQAYSILSPTTSTLHTLTLQMSTSVSDTLAFTLADGQLFMSARNERPVWLTSQEVKLTAFDVTRLNGTVPMVRVLLQEELRNATSTYRQNLQTETTYSVYR